MTTIEGSLGVVEHAVNAAYLSVDPGVTTGITFWNTAGEPVHYNELDIPSFYRLLDSIESVKPYRLRRIIVEEFRLYQDRALQQSGSKLETVQVIGALKYSNFRLKLDTVVEIRADAKETAAKWSETKWDFRKKTHMPNWLASYLVGYYWLHSTGIIPAKVLEQI